MDAEFKLKSFKRNAYFRCKSVSLFKKTVKTKQELKLNLGKVITLWRIKTYKLMKYGMFSDNPVRVQYLRNCPPSIGKFEKTKDSLRSCKFYSCPWCWLRKYSSGVLKRMLKVDNFMFYSMYKKVRYENKDVRNSVKLYREALQDASALSRKLTRRKNVVGGFSLVYFEPAKDGFSLVTRLLIASPSESFVPLEEFTPNLASRNKVRAAFVFGFYPFNFLSSKVGAKKLVYFIKNKTKYDKGFKAFGVFYGKT
jgi:hypothetical protein